MEHQLSSTPSNNIIKNKRYISSFFVLAFVLVSHNGQQQLEKLVAESLVRPFKQFEYETGTTPFSAWQWPISFCLGYIVLVFTLKSYMTNKTAWDMKYFRVVHNFILCFGSLLMFLGLAKEMYLVWQLYGWEALFCDCNSRQKTTGNLYFWYYVFFLSKFYEFIDTAILILRKRETSFLHVFHHFITAFMCWLGLHTQMSSQWLVVLLNSNVHIFMYYYYLAATLGSDVWWKKYLTSVQIIQFVIDLGGLYLWYFYKFYLGYQCSGNFFTNTFATSVVTSFLVLFILFYRKAFLTPKNQTTTTTKQD